VTADLGSNWSWRMKAPAESRAEHLSLRTGGLSAIALGVMYVVITVLYVVGGILPESPTDQLRQIAEQTTAWWLILGLSVATDLLFLPVMWSLWTVLRRVNAGLVLAGVGLVVLFVVLDLALTWPNFAVLIGLSDDFAATADDQQRTVLLAAATYAVAVVSSGLFAFYAIMMPGLGILMIGLVMLKARYGRVAAVVGIATGVLATVAVVGSWFVEAAEAAVIPTSILTTLWVFLVGFTLLRAARQPATVG